MPNDPFAGRTLDDLLEEARSKYDVTFETMAAGEHSLEVLQLADMEAYVERLARELPPNTPLELPFWAKVWRTAIILSFFVQKLPAQGRNLLEIGAGVGVCGLFAAAHGFNVTVTDIHPDALLFAKIGALKNSLDERVRVLPCDFTTDRLGERFDVVLGSEVLYMDEHYRALTKFLGAHLAKDEDAEIILAKEYTRKAKKFFKLAERDFAIRSSTMGFKSGEDEKHLTTIYRLTPRGS
ncbi:class I SAM-dependent methyltransferase [Desulfohalovibrio reitneri]|uniref:class I SAM-dependent methyltransferase n=1 Tax=Desulfohalovibrio reitneri TaxID=1307759 RepID=UPI0004A772CF|nr:methyltransferase domain-containing protein [Desulfohalovibrio reitneri]